METLNQHLNNIELKDRTLWFDGSCSVSSKKITEYLNSSIPMNKLFVDEITTEIQQYNMLVPPEKQLFIKSDVKLPENTWNIPEEYLTLDVENYVFDLYTNECKNNGWLDNHKDKNKIIKRYNRIKEELKLYTKMNLLIILRAIIFIINTLRTQKIVWGVGRGSSVSSYILYLIGAHDVDSVEYDIDITDFLRSEK